MDEKSEPTGMYVRRVLSNICLKAAECGARFNEVSDFAPYKDRKVQ